MNDSRFDVAFATPALAMPLAVAAIWLTLRFIRTGRRGPALAPGIVALATGLPFTVAPPAYEFGWFADAPLGSTGVPPMLNMWGVAGVILLASGLFALGCAVGARLRPREEPPN